MQKAYTEKDSLANTFKNTLIEANINKIKLFKNTRTDIYIYGAGRYGEIVLELCRRENIQPKGFIDNNKFNTELNGLKVYKESVLENKNCLIIISSLFNAGNIFSYLQSKGYKNLIHFLVLLMYYDMCLDQCTIFQETLGDYLFDAAINEEEYIKTFNLFEDEQSKKVLDYIQYTRYNLEYSNRFNYLSSLNNLYFEDDIIKLGENETFIDGGGFEGYVAQKFISKTNLKYGKIFFFEPCSENLNNAKQRLKNFPNITFINKAINDANKNFYLQTNLIKVGCYLSDEGNENIETTKIDSIIDEYVSFIKFDIEGYEKKGLLGAEKLIRKYKPKLAICSYHKPRDIWELPQIIKQINPDYKIYLRLYENNTDSVIYAV